LPSARSGGTSPSGDIHACHEVVRDGIALFAKHLHLGDGTLLLEIVALLVVKI